MPHIDLQNVDVTIPIFESGASRSLRAMIARPAVGAFIKHEIGNVTVINALNQINMQLEAGESCALIGHNGAGKSTLLRVLSGAYIPVQGTARVSGKIMSLLNLSLGMDMDTSGYDNIFIRGMMLGMKRSLIEDHVQDIIDFTELGDYIGMPVRTYSDGMCLRLMFGICTSFDSDILLIDEIIGVGDAEFFNKAVCRLEERVKKTGIVVIASHSLDILHRFCKRAVWLEHGNIRMSGNISEVVEKYLDVP